MAKKIINTSEYSNQRLNIVLLLQEAERNIAAAERLSEYSRFDKIVCNLCRQAIMCCQRAYFLHTGEALPQEVAFNDKDVSAALMLAHHAFASAFAVMREDKVG